MDDEMWSSVIEANLYGAFFCCRAVLPTMLAQNPGRIVNMSSVAQWQGLADGEANYCAAEAAVSAFTRCLAAEVAGENVTVNAVAPAIAWNPFLARVYGEEAATDGCRRPRSGDSPRPRMSPT